MKMFYLLTLFALCVSSLKAEERDPSMMVGLNLEAPRSLIAFEALLDLFKQSEGWFTSCRYDWQKKVAIDPGCSPNEVVSCDVPAGQVKDPFCDIIKKPEFTRTTEDTRETQYLKNYTDDDLWIKSLPKPEDKPIFTYVTRAIKVPEGFSGGRFVLTYDGEGEVVVAGRNAQTNNLMKTYISKNRIEFDIDHVSVVKIHLYKTNPANYIRNIKVFRKSNEQYMKSEYFHPNYVNKLKEFDFLRYMTWTEIRENFVVEWKDRSHPNAAQYSGYTSKSGMPEELMIDLANKTNTSMWLSVPAAVNDDYVTNYAKLVKSTLNKDLKVIVEYSNEMWNSIFPATHYAKGQAITSFNSWAKDNNIVKYATPATNGNGEVQYNYNQAWKNYFESKGITKDWQQNAYLSINHYAKRTVEICKIWKDVFGDQANRVKCVLASYSGAPQWGEETLACPMFAESLGNKSCADFVDHYSVGPYFGHEMFQINWRQELMNWVEMQERYNRAIANGTPVSSLPVSGLEMMYKELLEGGVLYSKNAAGEYLDKRGKVTVNPSEYVQAFPGGVMKRALDFHMGQNIALAKKFGKTLVAYEAGQHLIRHDGGHRIRWDFLKPAVLKRNPNLTEEQLVAASKEWQSRIFKFLRAAQNDPKMKQSYKTYLNSWKAQGGSDICHFSGIVNYFEEEIFGLFDTMGQTSSPKYDALMEFKKSL